MPGPSAWVVRHAPRIRKYGTALDVAAGGGRHTRYLRERGYRIVAVDADVAPLESLREDPAVELVAADLEGGPWPFGDRRFDGIVVTNYLHRPLFPVLAASLRPGGVLIYETFAKGHERYGRPRNPDYLLVDGELRAVFGELLEIVAYEQAVDEAPKPALKQRVCAVKPSTDAHATSGGGA